MFSQVVTFPIRRACNYLSMRPLVTAVKTQINEIFRNLDGITKATARSLSISPDALNFDHIGLKAGSELECKAVAEAVWAMGFCPPKHPIPYAEKRGIRIFIVPGSTMSVAIELVKSSIHNLAGKASLPDHICFVIKDREVFNRLMCEAIPGQSNVIEKAEKPLAKIIFRLPAFACYKSRTVEILPQSPADFF